MNSDPFVLVLEGSIPNEDINREGFWAAMGVDAATGQPIPTVDWIKKLAPKALAVVACGTCATYGGIHAMAGNATGAMGLADLLGWNFRSAGGHPHRECPRLPGPARQLHGDGALSPVSSGGHGAHDSARRQAAPDLAVRKNRARGLRSAGYYEQGDFAPSMVRPSAWSNRLLGTGRQLQRHQARVDGRNRRMPQCGRHLHRLHDARIPR